MGCFLAAASVASVIHLARSSGAGPEPELLAATDPAPEGLHVATGAETRSVAVGAHRFTLAEHSEILAVGDDTEGWRVELWRGRIELEVAPQRDRPPFTIRSGEVEVRVVGTLLSVQREGASTEVHVSRGIVEVEHEGRVGWHLVRHRTRHDRCCARERLLSRSRCGSFLGREPLRGARRSPFA
jgi:ferric-dicitrate binding protein FerR (iron transport regulator)